MTRIIGIVSGKGGVGKSTVAVNLALALKKFKKSVTLVDCNLSTPHLSYYLGATDYIGTINDVLKDKLDIQSALYNYNGIRYLPASVKFEDLIGVELTKFKKHLSKLEKSTDFIILDASPGLGKEALFVMDASREILFVTTPFVPMIGDVIRCKEVLKQFDEKKMSILLNMVTYGTHELKKEVVEELTGLPVLGEIPHDNNVMQSLVMRYPLLEYKPNSLASISFMRVASLLTEKDYEIPMKVKWHKWFTTIKNILLPNEIRMSNKAEDVKRELLSNF
ncbi:MAG: MinD/ParA family protein [Candidatus Aenigmatarchaeota archaeon]|nr:MinD/ParA family protein [Candidatus Aenigmarchaeota archaeon]